MEGLLSMGPTPFSSKPRLYLKMKTGVFHNFAKINNLTQITCSVTEKLPIYASIVVQSHKINLSI